MMRIAERIAADTECLGLITGESIGQVASQTMQSLAATNEVCTMPVYRPLIGMDKQEIIDISEKIGTYETSILPFEDCCTIFVAKHPVTKPNVNVIRKHERFLGEEIEGLVETALATKEMVIVGERSRFEGSGFAHRVLGERVGSGGAALPHRFWVEWCRVR